MRCFYVEGLDTGSTVSRASNQPMRSEMTNRVYGIDWSGAKRAGDKIWVATIDREQKAVIDVRRPWSSQMNPDVTAAVSDWISLLESGWVGLDSPLGLASIDRTELIGTTNADPFDWSAELVRLYPDRDAFVTAAVEARLIGRHRRKTDAGLLAPFPPLLFQLIHQTYAALSLVSRLDRSRVRILPWEHACARPVTLIETCPAVVLKTAGLSNRGYKLKANSEAVRGSLIRSVLKESGLNADGWVHDIIRQDREGDALDAILCAIAASNAMTTDHAEIACQPGALDEGWIYV